jgi:N-acetylglucosaminyl-diphospho-decaprenol L-rhamnosyltransferase
MDVVIVTYNSASAIGQCLQSLSQLREAGNPVIVIENASQDGTADVVRSFEDVHLHANPENLGFAAAVNQGFRAGSGRYVLLLNPDTVLLTPDLKMMEQKCEEYGLASGMLLDAAGAPQRGFFARSLPTGASLSFEVLGLNRLWPSNPINRKFRRLDLTGDKEEMVEQPPGAFLMIRRDVWEELGGFDESFYPVWFEDTDFCKRALDKGYQIRFSPDFRVAHEGGHSVLRVDEAARGVYWYGSLLRYAAKHFRPLTFGMVCTATVAGSFFRMLAGCLQAGLKPVRWVKTVRMYGRVTRLAFRSLISGGVSLLGDRRRSDVKSVVSAVRQ